MLFFVRFGRGLPPGCCNASLSHAALCPDHAGVWQVPLLVHWSLCIAVLLHLYSGRAANDALADTRRKAAKRVARFVVVFVVLWTPEVRVACIVEADVWRCSAIASTLTVAL